ncbi:MAG: HlyD family secretion protein, partial [Candidatus Eremiobacteraeota bacterium]|nr:HlyD family secretion protein [Candidatus Eremiobacteraeota bacterium]
MNQRFLVAGALLALALSACTKVGQTTGVGTEGSSGGTGPHEDRLV